jgi:hypothetical protein
MTTRKASCSHDISIAASAGFSLAAQVQTIVPDPVPGRKAHHR